ncbi:hypothetical protein F5Y06DRAFT_301605 [Hypoxylon sp. FL0890]|nr:hypothetical protein F5Y06DRAFT_301605 [Hypoxylon sp. FL0890]
MVETYTQGLDASKDTKIGTDLVRGKLKERLHHTLTRCPGGREPATAEPTKVFVKKKHFSIVANASIQLNAYLLVVHGDDEDKVAKREYMCAVELSPLASKGLDQDDYDSSSKDKSSNGPGMDSDSDDSNELNKCSKKTDKPREGKETKGNSKRVKKASDKKGKSKKKLKENGKAIEEDESD